MSIQSEIERISGNIADAYASVQSKDGTIPEEQTSDNLAEAVESIPQTLDNNPIGTVISFMGTAAPNRYLVCDGAEYSVSEYPDLAAFFAEQFGAANHFGGDGTTTFAVPDMPGSANMAVLYCIKAVESVPPENVYSTEETRIGTWIDGKPLYRKTVHFTTIEGDLNISLNTEISNLVNAFGSVYNGSFFIPLLMHAGSDKFITAAFLFKNGDLIIRTKSGGYVNLPGTITIEYTKTTG